MASSDIIDLLCIILFVAMALGLYFLPAIIAARKKHPNKIAIFLCNLFFGGSGVGWIICLIWAITYKVRQNIIEIQRL